MMKYFIMAMILKYLNLQICKHRYILAVGSKQRLVLKSKTERT